MCSILRPDKNSTDSNLFFGLENTQHISINVSSYRNLFWSLENTSIVYLEEWIIRTTNTHFTPILAATAVLNCHDNQYWSKMRISSSYDSLLRSNYPAGTRGLPDRILSLVQTDITYVNGLIRCMGAIACHNSGEMEEVAHVCLSPSYSPFPNTSLSQPTEHF